MQCMYFSLMMIGGVVLIITLIMGEIFEFGHDLGDSVGGAVDGLLDNFGFHLPHLLEGGEDGGGPSPLSSRVIFSFITAFGGMGTIMTYYGFPDLVTILLSIVVGFIGGAVVWAFTFTMFRKSATSQLKDADFIEVPGIVTMGIPGNASCGEVSITIQGNSEIWFAVSSNGQPIPVNTPITVISKNGGRLTVKVSN